MRSSKEPSVINQFLSDESNGFFANSSSIAGVCYPENEEDVVEAILEAARNKIPVNISGAGTGLTGARVPVQGGLVLSTEKLLKAPWEKGCREICFPGLSGELVFYIDEEKMVAHVAPGVTLRELEVALPGNMMYPPDPTETLASLGGTVATNASGARCFYYGATRRWVQGLRVVLADGEILDIQRGECRANENGFLNFSSISGKTYSVQVPNYTPPDVKNAAGLFTEPNMDLIDLFIGSEGILGTFTRVTIGLSKREKAPVMDMVFFDNQKDALSFVEEAKQAKEKGILSVEYFDSRALDFVKEQQPNIPDETSGAVLLEITGGNLDLMAYLSQIIYKHKAIEDWCANNSVDRRQIKELRHSVPEEINTYLRQHDSCKMGTDFAVPHSHLQDMINAYKTAEEQFRTMFPREGPHTVTFGHIGDSHLHFNFITSTPQERAFCEELYKELAMTSISLGGTISGEHGVGKKTMPNEDKRIPYLQLMYGENGLHEIARVKKALDPAGILNPGNMIPPHN